MLLQKLAGYADRLGATPEREQLPPVRYQFLPVRYVIELDGAGRLLTEAPTDLRDPASKETKDGRRMHVPSVVRTSGIKPLLLVDKADYVLGLAADDADEKTRARAAACHAAFAKLLTDCAAATANTSVEAVVTFLAGRPREQLRLPDDFDAGARITFQVDGVFPIHLPDVQAWWAGDGSDQKTDGQCLVCGRMRPPQERLDAKLKGVPGGQSSGTALISANEEAFESYGRKASLNAPICASCAKRFTDGANALLRDERSRIYLGGSVFVFWTREPVEDHPLGADLLEKPRPEQVRDLLASVRGGGRAGRVESTRFYGAVLSGAGGRAVVRDWIDTTVEDASARVAAWFRRQSVVMHDGGEHRPCGLLSLAGATVRALDELPATVLPTLVRCALAGTPLQLDLLVRAVRRARVEGTVTHPRASLIKLVLASRAPDWKEDWMVGIEPEHPCPAYHCGRLLAVIGEVQRRALPGAKSTVIDRFYGAASSTPATVFGGLLRQAQPHLAKLERDQRGAYIALERQLGEVCERLTAFPKTLTLEEQGLFALGYYHQQAHQAQGRAEARRRKDERLASGNEEG